MNNALQTFTPKIDIKRLMLAVAMVAAVVSNAHAAPPNDAPSAHPRAEVTISSSSVTLGDIFADVSHDAGYVLAPAPAADKPLVLSANDLQRVSDAFNLGWTSTGAVDRTVVRSKTQDVDSYAIDAALQSAAKHSMPGSRFDLQPSDRSLSLHVPQDQPATVDVTSFRTDAARGTFTATLVAPSAANPLVRKDISGHYYLMTQVPVLKTSFRAGDLISQNDIVYADMREDDISAGTLRDATQLVGYTPRRVASANKPLLTTDLEMPVMVKKGDLITMVLSNTKLKLTMQGKALQSGAEGDIVRVLNPSSNQTIEGRVTGAQTVTVSSPSAQLAQN